MRRSTLCAAVTMGLVVSASVSARQPGLGVDLSATLERAGQRVEQYFARAQTLVCLETVYVQPLGTGLSPEGAGRTIESEMRLDWDPSAGRDGPVEARTLRQVLKVNGRPPRPKDHNNCTAPEQHDTETQPLSMLLPAQRREYAFSLAGLGRAERRAAIMVDYKLLAQPSVEVQEVEGNEDCISFSLSGGLRGRIWLDAESYDVLRLDQGLMGLVDIPLPKKSSRRSGNDSWTMERWDSSIRFKPVAFQDPDETLLLPVQMSSLRITRGSGMPRLRTVTDYSRYRRFLTGGRIVKEPGGVE